MRGLSIRWRLTLWYGSVLAVVLTIFGAAVYFIMQHHLFRRVDAGLEEELSDVLSEVERAQTQDGMLVWLDRRFAYHEGFDFQVTPLGAERIFANPRLGDLQLPLPKLEQRGAEIYESIAVPNGRRWRLVSRRVAGSEGDLIVQVARSLDWYDHEMAELLAVLFLTGPLSLVAALSGGYLLACRALRPVDQMTQTADRITAQQLGERLDVANPHDELGRLAWTLNGMIERLEKSFREMQRFTADASHELRTPIAVIRNEAEVALNKPLGADEHQNLLSSILEECERLTWITDQLLTLCREDAGIAQSIREPVDLAGLVSEVSETMRPLAEAKHQRLIVNTDGYAEISGDPARLRHVFYNLFDNSIKYTPEGGTIEARVQANEQAVAMTVRDTGIGIPAEHLPHVFDRFYRVDKARSRAEGGTGLGLSIVQSIVTAHAGQVDITSTPGQGTTVTIALPKAQNQHSPGE